MYAEGDNHRSRLPQSTFTYDIPFCRTNDPVSSPELAGACVQTVAVLRLSDRVHAEDTNALRYKL